MRFLEFFIVVSLLGSGTLWSQCATCHSKIAATFAKTGMARSFYKPTAIEPVRFYHKSSETWYAITERDGSYFQRRWRIGYSGRETEVQESRIDYVMGSGNHVRTYLHRTDRGALIELPLAQYSENGGSENGGQWAMNPGHDRDYTLPPRTVAYECMFCHNAYPKIPSGHDEPGSEPLFEGALPEGIGCERCHGDGANHMRAAQTAAGKVPATADAIRRAIVNPARLSKDRQMEVCMQCHLETTSLQLPHSIVKYGRAPFSYQPGEPLGNFMIFFDHAAGSPYRNDFEIAHSAYRLRKSRCFLESKMTCITCHNPHDIPRGEEATQHYNGVCNQCHQSLPAKHTKAADCVSCHMPKRRTQDVVHAVMTDHYIQRRLPAKLLAPLAERQEFDGKQYRGPVVPYYPSPLPRTPENLLYEAVAQVTQQSNLKAGLPQLVAEIAKQQPSRPQFYVELGEAWLNAGKPRNAVSAFEEALKRVRAPNSSVAVVDLASALTQTGQNARATEVLKRGLSAGLSDPLLWYQLGLAAHDPNAFSKAPDLSEAHDSLGELLAGSGDLARAESEFREALRIEPDMPSALSNLGHALAARGALPEAAWYFERAVRRSPNDADTRVNFAATLTGLNRQDDALRELQAALKLRPDFGLAHLNAAAILAARGDAAAAKVHLLQAAKDRDPEIRRRAEEKLK